MHLSQIGDSCSGLITQQCGPAGEDCRQSPVGRRESRRQLHRRCGRSEWPIPLHRKSTKKRCFAMPDLCQSSPACRVWIQSCAGASKRSVLVEVRSNTTRPIFGGVECYRPNSRYIITWHASGNRKESSSARLFPGQPEMCTHLVPPSGRTTGSGGQPQADRQVLNLAFLRHRKRIVKQKRCIVGFAERGCSHSHPSIWTMTGFDREFNGDTVL